MIVVYITVFSLSLLSLIYLKNSSGSRLKQIIKKLSKQDIYDDLNKFTSRIGTEKKLTLFYIKKLTALFITVMAGSLVCIVMEAAFSDGSVIKDTNRISRDDYNGDDKVISIWAQDERSKEKVKLDLTVQKRKYDRSALESMCDEAQGLLPEIIKGENISLDEIIFDLDAVRSIEGFPFDIEYRSYDPVILGSDGKINKENILKREGYEGGIPVNIAATFKYEDFRRELSLYVRVFYYEDKEDATFEDGLREEIKKAEESTKCDESLVLPINIDGTPVSYKEEDSHETILVFILTLVVGALIYKRDDQELKTKVKLRNEQMLSDYPGIINKFAIFYGAGMTTKGIMLKLCRDYEQKREKGLQIRYAYEELLRTRQRMEEGMGELSAYEDYGKRCQIHKYRQLVNLMEQTVSKGRSDIGLLLEEEARAAFTEKKNRAREMGEKAGTRLLVPMFLMLAVVLIIIIMPAMVAFNM